MIWHVYVIKSEEGYVYAGMTRNLGSRISKHNTGQVTSTKKGNNWKIVYSEWYCLNNSTLYNIKPHIRGVFCLQVDEQIWAVKEV